MPSAWHVGLQGASQRPFADHEQVAVGQPFQPCRGRLDQPLHAFLRFQAADERDDAASGANAQCRKVGRLPGGILFEIDAVGDNHKFLRRKTAVNRRELGNRPADTDVAIHPALGQTIEPQVPPRPAFGHADSADDEPHPGTAGSDPAEEIGMKEKCLDNLGILGCQEPSETPGHDGKLPDAASAEAVDLDAGRLQGGQARGIFPCGSGTQAVDDRREPSAVDPQGQFRQAPFGAAEVEFRDAEGDVDSPWLRAMPCTTGRSTAAKRRTRRL